MTMSGSTILTSTAVAVISIMALGFYDIFTNFENNSCEMTYMFEYPEYQKIEMGKNGYNFPFYSLYLYGEGAYFKTLRTLKLTGIPVLFIPGNAGSYKQVRSLGSVALRMAEYPTVKHHFNYFSVDFNEELSGLYGGVLERQTDFVLLCVEKIMQIYGKSGSRPPTSLILVGHSMGGVIARALFTRSNFNPLLVSVIITQATPHRRPVADLDADINRFYSGVNGFWKDHGNTSLRHVTVVSTGGGFRDVQVRYALTSLDGIVPANRAVSVSTTSIPRAWVSTDHLCAVWCRQVVVLTQTALFDMIDKTTGQVMKDPDQRMKVLRHHFLANNGLPDYLNNQQNATISLDPKAKWEVRRERIWTYAAHSVATTTYLAVPLFEEDSKSNDAVVVTSNLSNWDWICLCDIPKGQDKCKSCTSLSSHSRFLPPRYSQSKYVQLMFSDIKGSSDTYIIVIVPAGHKTVNILTDIYNSNTRHLMYQMPNTYDTIISYPISATDGAAMLKISNGSSFYSLHLAGLSLPTNTYTAVITPQSCRKHSAETFEGSVLRLHIPWSNEDTYVFSSYGKEASIPIKLQSGRPPGYDWRLDASEPHLEMFLHPYCHYHLKLLVATRDSLGQAVRFYAIQLPGYYVTVLLMMLAGLILAHSKGQAESVRTRSPADILIQHGSPLYLIPVAIILRFIIQLRPVSSLLGKLGVPGDDSASLTDEGIYLTLLPLFLYLIAWLFIYLQAAVAINLLNIFSYVGRLFVCVPDSVLRWLSYIQLGVVGLAVLSTFVCGTLGLLCLSLLLIFKILHMFYEIGIKLDNKDTHRRLMLTVLWMLVVNAQILMSLGQFAAWVKQVTITGDFLQQLYPDSSRLPALILSVCIPVQMYAGHIIPPKYQISVSAWLVYTLALVVVLYATESLYRLPLIISIAVIIVTLPMIIEVVSQRTQKQNTKKI